MKVAIESAEQVLPTKITSEQRYLRERNSRLQRQPIEHHGICKIICTHREVETLSRNHIGQEVVVEVITWKRQSRQTRLSTMLSSYNLTQSKTSEGTSTVEYLASFTESSGSRTVCESGVLILSKLNDRNRRRSPTRGSRKSRKRSKRDRSVTSSDDSSSEEERRRRKESRRSYKEKEKARDRDSSRRHNKDKDDDERRRRRRRSTPPRRTKSSASPERPPQSAEDEDDEWVEKPPTAAGAVPTDVHRPIPVETMLSYNPALDDDSDSDGLGPRPLTKPSGKRGDDHRSYGSALLRGEGSAMAAFLAEDTESRIPRRGEIGLTADEIDKFEQSGYVMSGSRHRMMNAVRMRKENQVISAEEKRGILKLQKEERARREEILREEFGELVKDKLKEQGRK